MKTIIHKTLYILLTVWLFSFQSCDDFMEIDTPYNRVSTTTVFSDARTIRAVANGLYTENLLNNRIYYYWTPFVYSAIADDVTHTSTSYDELKYNAYGPTSSNIADFWTLPYKSIYLSNDLLEKLSKTSLISDEEKQIYFGEAKYFRAYNYYLLTYSFGDVPRVRAINAKETALLPRETQETIVQDIIQDLKDAETGLEGSDNPNTKVTKTAASALLARIYLYHKEWQNAETKASEVIETPGLALEALENVFLRSSKESIFKTSTSGSWSSYVNRTYFGQLLNHANYFRLTDDLIASFEPDDNRKTKWTIQKTASGVQYHHSQKYKQSATPTNAALSEDHIHLRLGEQYLIRAEARAQQNKLTGTDGAIADLDAIRIRAGLTALSQTLTKEEVLLQVEKERRSELFIEEAHRWFDLGRTGRIDAVLGAISEKRWEPYKALFPISDTEIRANPNLTPNPGYGTIK
jgi:hypothetical protein